MASCAGGANAREARWRARRLRNGSRQSIRAMTASMMRYPGLDLIRTAAGLAVMIAHAAFWLAPFGLPDTVWLLLGHIGVEAFLVCTSFLLSLALLGSAAPAMTRSWARAVLRLWPLYALLVLVNLAFVGLLAQPWPSLSAYLSLTQNLAWPHPPFFGEAWIVAAAMMVFIVVPLVCLGLRSCTFVAGCAWLIAAVIITIALRATLVSLGEPTFDLGVRKVLVMRLDLPLYGILLAWCWTHRRAPLLRYRALLAAVGAIALIATACCHLWSLLDDDTPMRIALLTVCDLGWALLVPWACATKVAARPARGLAILAGSAYAGLLTHMTLLRLGLWLGMPMQASGRVHGLAMLTLYVALATFVALLVRYGLDRPLLGWRDRLLPNPAQGLPPVAER